MTNKKTETLRSKIVNFKDLSFPLQFFLDTLYYLSNYRSKTMIYIPDISNLKEAEIIHKRIRLLEQEQIIEPYHAPNSSPITDFEDFFYMIKISITEYEFNQLQNKNYFCNKDLSQYNRPMYNLIAADDLLGTYQLMMAKRGLFVDYTKKEYLAFVDAFDNLSYRELLTLCNCAKYILSNYTTEIHKSENCKKSISTVLKLRKCLLNMDLLNIYSIGYELNHFLLAILGISDGKGYLIKEQDKNI